MSALKIDPLFLLHKPLPRFHIISKKTPPNHLNYINTQNRRFTIYSRHFNTPQAVSSTQQAPALQTSDDVTFTQTFQLQRHQKVQGKITIKLENGKTEDDWNLTVCCSLPGKWVLHWGVNYIGDVGSEWDQPPLDMRPPGSIPIKDYAIETPLDAPSESLGGEQFYQVKIEFNTNTSIGAINFVLKDEETGHWYQHKGRDFKVPLTGYVEDESNLVGTEKGIGWPGASAELTKVVLNTKTADSSGEDTEKAKLQKSPLKGFYEEHSVFKETIADNSLNVSMKHCLEKATNTLSIETDLPGDVVVHWGVCSAEGKTWEIPTEPYPPETSMFKNKALRTLLQQQRDDARGSFGSFELDETFSGFVFVLKLDDDTWLNNQGKDFYIPFSSSAAADKHPGTVGEQLRDLGASVTSGYASDSDEEVSAYTEGIIKEIRNLVSGISSEKSRKTKSKEAQEIILQEIEKLAAEAYSIFRSSIPSFTVDTLKDEIVEPPLKICSGTGTGHEILCQGFNWESHKSGKWYIELLEKASELSSMGFTVIWLPPPTDSVSPEGYMPRDLYNLNSRYGNLDQLKALVKKLHEFGIRTLGDAVINHRCAQKQNQNGVWNIFGGKLNWDDRAVVADDPHFQGRGNKSSGDNFHAAPNIDHSQDFVRNDIKEWLRWLREEVGYDGWRLDFVRGFWGGYVKDYLESSEPYFAVGEFWDSLSYSYGEMDHNQDAHRQRIVDWINATNGTAGAFDVTTKGILHSALERCEYWRLSDEKGKPPGVMGWWPSRAITFIENHDTGSTQGHWRFPGGKEMQGYAYILTHPGTPSVFFDHIFSDYKNEIAKLISIRKENKINCRSLVKIVKSERDVYAAIVDEKLAMKIGPGHYEPSDGKWSVAIEGRDYKVWELSS